MVLVSTVISKSVHKGYKKATGLFLLEDDKTERVSGNEIKPSIKVLNITQLLRLLFSLITVYVVEESV